MGKLITGRKYWNQRNLLLNWKKKTLKIIGKMGKIKSLEENIGTNKWDVLLDKEKRYEK